MMQFSQIVWLLFLSSSGGMPGWEESLAEEEGISAELGEAVNAALSWDEGTCTEWVAGWEVFPVLADGLIFWFSQLYRGYIKAEKPLFEN